MCVNEFCFITAEHVKYVPYVKEQAGRAPIPAPRQTHMGLATPKKQKKKPIPTPRRKQPVPAPRKRPVPLPAPRRLAKPETALRYPSIYYSNYLVSHHKILAPTRRYERRPSMFCVTPAAASSFAGSDGKYHSLVININNYLIRSDEI